MNQHYEIRGQHYPEDNPDTPREPGPAGTPADALRALGYMVPFGRTQVRPPDHPGPQ
jgi:hypothetical protein